MDGTAVEIDGTYTGADKSQKKGRGGLPRGALRYKKHGLIVVQERHSRRMVVESCGQSENQKDADRIMRTWIEPGTAVVSDSHAAFNHASEIVGGIHLTVNHSQHLVNPRTRVHINNVECRNRHIKQRFKDSGRAFARNDEVLWGNIAYYVWRQWFSDGSGSMQFGMIFMAIYNSWGF